MSEIDIFVSSIGNFNIISLDHVMKSKNKAFVFTFVSADEDAEVLKEMRGRFAARSKAVSVTGRMQHPGPQPTCVFSCLVWKRHSVTQRARLQRICLSITTQISPQCARLFVMSKRNVATTVHHDTELAALSEIVRDANDTELGEF